MKLIFVSLVLLFNFFSIESCNESRCGSVITKCLLNNLCSCKHNDLKCLNECYSCLEETSVECCSCLNLCPKEITFDKLNTISYVEKIDKPLPKLFKLLTNKNNKITKWTSFNVTQYFEEEVLKTEIIYDPLLKNTCSVIFSSKCISNSKCKLSCAAMGSSFYRWFHNGCCECGSGNCLNYGLEEAKCSDCFL